MYSMDSTPVRWKLGTLFEGLLVVSFFLPFVGSGKTFFARSLRTSKTYILYITLFIIDLK